MANYHAKWANSALRPSIFVVIDAYAGIPFILLAFDLDNFTLLKLSLVCVLILCAMRYLGFTPQACALAIRKVFSRFMSGSRRGTSQFFELTINRLLH
ncbi:MAG TPA: hypothetical protein DCW52_06455 [Gammaproteobacteria bacterium]|jgi:hypothetical protein|nr:hypothetical protein [Gammaproteobacteria bacterium]